MGEGEGASALTVNSIRNRFAFCMMIAGCVKQPRKPALCSDGMLENNYLVIMRETRDRKVGVSPTKHLICWLAGWLNSEGQATLSVTCHYMKHAARSMKWKRW